MNTLDLVRDAEKTTISELERLSAGARRWIVDNLEYLDPSNPALGDTAKVKASLELAVLCRIWTRLRPGDRQLAAPTAMARKIWQDKDFPLRMATTPRYLR